jgi:hypothetical protein
LDELGDESEPGNPVSNLVGYFREHPARFFGIAGTVVFVAGWAGAIYVALFSDIHSVTGVPSYYKVQILVTIGTSVTTASAILWGIAAYIWIHLLPDAPTPSN